MKFKLFDNSILEIVAQPIKIFKRYKDVSLRHTVFYEHIYGPVVIASAIRFLPSPYKWVGLSALILFHLVIKEFLHDGIRDGKVDWNGVIERTYGCLLATLVTL